MKSFILFMFTVILIANITGCSAPQTDITPPAPDAAVTSGIQEETDYFESLPQKDFDGRDFTVMAMDASSLGWYNYYTEELAGDVVNDAVLMRNQLTEDRLSINILTETAASPASEVRSAVLADDIVCDMFFYAMSSESAVVLSENLLSDLSEFEYLSLDEIWWNKSIAENMRINGRQYFTSGPIAPMYLKTPIVMTYNKNLALDYNIENIYDLVTGGTWTVEKMASIMTAAARDLDGDGIIGENDQFGLSVEPTFGLALYAAAGLQGVELTETGEYFIRLGEDKSVDFIERCNSLFSDRDITYVRPTSANEMHAEIFNDGRALFSDFTVQGIIAYYRNMEDDYGIIPVPKADEGAGGYHTTCNTWLPSATAVPVNCGDTGSTGLIMETMAYLSQQYITPAVCEITMEGKITRDDESIEMLNIIYADATFDFNTIYDFASNNALLYDCILGRKDNFASSLAAVEDKIRSEVEKLIEEASGGI